MRARFLANSNSRYGLAALYFLSLMLGWFTLRLVLFLAFKSAELPLANVMLTFWSGFHRDVFVALVETIPLLVWFWLVPERHFGARWHRFFLLGTAFVACYTQIFLLFVEFFFFEEFKSRFNTVAVDYLLYPREVFINIWESYHVGLILALCLGLTAGWVWAALR